LTITNGAWSGAGYAYWAESFPTRVRGTAIGAMSALGLILGTLLWTILISISSPAVTWFVIAVVFGSGQWTVLLLPRIEPRQ
jgi:MFS family permease